MVGGFVKVVLYWADTKASRSFLAANMVRARGCIASSYFITTCHARRMENYIEVLKWHKAKQNKQKEELGDAYNDLGLVFSDVDGGIITPNTMGTRFARIMDKTNIPKRTFHRLWHTFASVAISQGLNIKTISSILGHEKASTTLDIYGHLMPGDTETVVKAVAAYYGL